MTLPMIPKDEREMRTSPAEKKSLKTASETLVFEKLYDDYADFVFRSLKRLGVDDASVDDALQEVFLVVHRRMSAFRGSEFIKTWIFRIAMHVAQETKRKGRRGTAPRQTAISEVDVVPDVQAKGPLEEAMHAEKIRLLYEILDQMDDDKRAIFIMSELEQLSVKDMAEAMNVNMNTMYSRVRVARESFDDALARHRAREGSSS